MATDKEGNTPLHAAASKGFDRIVALLLANGADVNSMNSRRETPLYLTAAKGQMPTMQILLNAGARVEEGVSPLYAATTDEAAQTLLKHGAEIQEVDKTKDQALIKLAGNGVDSIVKILLKQGHNIEASNERGQTALLEAICQKQENMACILLEHGAQVDYRTKPWECSPLESAISGGCEIVAHVLLENGANPDAKDTLSGRPSLALASGNGMESFVRLLLERGADLDEVDGNGCTALYWAVNYGHEPIVRLLLEKGAKVNPLRSDREFMAGEKIDNSPYEYGWNSPLCVASSFGYANLVRLLVDFGADVDGKGIRPESRPLSAAAYMGHLVVVQMLLEIGSDLNIGQGGMQHNQADDSLNSKAISTPLEEDPHFKSTLSAALSRAIRNNKYEVVKLLLERGADYKPRDWWQPRYEPVKEDFIGICELLLDAGVDFNIEKPLHNYLEEGQLALTHRLLRRLKSFRPSEENQKTLLSQAAKMGCEEIVRIMLEMGADPDAEELCFDPGEAYFGHVSHICWTALSYAAKYGHVAVMELLWRGKAKTWFLSDPEQFLLGVEYERICKLIAEGLSNVNLSHEDGRRLLHMAAAYGHERSVRILLGRGADPTVKTASGMTPAHYAAQSRNTSVLQLILEQNVDVNARNEDGQTPLYQAVERACDAVVKVLLENGAETETKSDGEIKNNRNININTKAKRHEQGYTPLHCAASRGHNVTAQLLLAHGAQVEARDTMGATPLMLAALRGQGAIAKTLLEHGADVKAADNEGRTALHQAALGGWMTAVRTLLDCAQFEARDVSGATPLLLAAYEGKGTIVKILLEHGADATAADNEGRTALHQAALVGWTAVVRVLLGCAQVDRDAKDANGNTALALAEAQAEAQAEAEEHEGVIGLLKMV